ncbi:gluconokinase [Streptomyces apocyni]|uniref:gluconokinase n=1 Tax=Streptomyces apocyni TaxID=2654677 RepID=UPI0012EAE202|nr:gluconokinase [Streptomyces apocyni]
MEADRVVVVMGVSGAGKSVVGELLAAELDVAYAEADAFHPAANIAKMAFGTPLDDEDRWPWLEAIGEWAKEQEGHGGVVSCSALKRAYRDRLRAAAPGIAFIHLSGDRDLIAERQAAREDHFMPSSLLDSQFATLEPLESDELGITVDVTPTPKEIATQAAARLREL